MSSSPTVQLNAAALDTLGMSVATSPASASDTRVGSAYDPLTWAAAAPGWFHPLSGRVLMLAGRRWHDATSAGDASGSYSAFTEDTAPSWAMITPLTGQRSAVPGQPINVPMNAAGTSVSLVGAASRGSTLLFVLSAATVDGIATGVLQRFQLNPASGSVTLALEEVLPTPNDITFTAGVQFDGASLIVYGTDASHQVYKMSKPYGLLGINTLRTVPIKGYTSSDAVGVPRGWGYYTGTGYSAEASELTPLTTPSGVLTTRGPMSFGAFRNQTFMTTVNLSGTTYSGQFWRSRSGQSFESISAPVALGSSADGSYLGGGVYLQSQLAPNPVAAPMTAPGVLSGIPYVSGSKLVAGSGHMLDVVWGILAVTA